MYLVALSEVDVCRNDSLYRQYRALKMEDGWHPGDKTDAYSRLLGVIRLGKLSVKNSSVLDVGCGTGDLSSYLRRRGVEAYTGVDILGSAIREARLKYPGELFLYQDILRQPLKTEYDFVFCSGALSTKLATDNYLFLGAMIKAMWKATKKGLVFNFLSDEDDDPDPDLFFYNIDQIKAICRKVGSRARIKVLKNKDKAQVHVFMVRKGCF